jgi:hypothetical protein
MTWRSMTVICAVFAALAVGSFHSTGAGPGPTEPGQIPYTPSRIEWLALTLEATYHDNFMGSGSYGLHYLQKPPNTIQIFVQYTDDTPIGPVDHGIDTAKKLIREEAANYGWSWVKIEVKRDLVSKD